MSLQKIIFKTITCALVFWVSGVAAQSVPIENLKITHNFEEDYDAKKWGEIVHQLPPVPKPENLIEFFVSAATEHRFFIDPDSVSIAKDGVARYALVIKTSGGATNISFEGMRCETRERRPYAFGRSDGTWSKTRSNAWVPIHDEIANRQYAALFMDYFCPNGILAGRAEDIRFALRHQQGGKPRVSIGQ